MSATYTDYRSSRQMCRDRTRWQVTADYLRCVIVIAVSVWFCFVFWLPLQRVRDGGPPELAEIILIFHIPLAIGLTLAGRLVARSADISRSIGIVCLLTLIPAVIEILIRSSEGAGGVWVYRRG